jgi:paraquat-inducible protein A
MGAKIVCCHECDELVKVSNPHREGRFKCPNCGNLLFRHKEGMVERIYALGISSLVLFALTNYFPFISFHVAGNTSHANFFTSSIYLFQEEQFLLAVALMMTTMVVPFIRIMLILTLFGPLYYGYLPRYAPVSLKLLTFSQPWAMLDVFLVGVFVSMVKLVKMGTIIPGTSLWAFMVMVFVMAGMQVTLNPHPIWERIEEQQKRRKTV